MTIGDDVEIGANTTIDGALEDTVIGEGAKIDNLAQVAHNCQIGAYLAGGLYRHCGSVTLGEHCIVGGAGMIRARDTGTGNDHFRRFAGDEEYQSGGPIYQRAFRSIVMMSGCVM